MLRSKPKKKIYRNVHEALTLAYPVTYALMLAPKVAKERRFCV